MCIIIHFYFSVYLFSSITRRGLSLSLYLSPSIPLLAFLLSSLLMIFYVVVKILIIPVPYRFVWGAVEVYLFSFWSRQNWCSEFLNYQIQNLEREIQEKRRQMRVLEQRIVESSEASVSSASLVEMQQVVLNSCYSLDSEFVLFSSFLVIAWFGTSGIYYRIQMSQFMFTSLCFNRQLRDWWPSVMRRVLSWRWVLWNH